MSVGGLSKNAGVAEPFKLIYSMPVAKLNPNSLISCLDCGIQYLANNYAACPSCGSKMKSSGEELKQVSISASLHCPVCMQSDLIQRVSTIIDSGTTSTVGFGLSTPISLHHQPSSMLAFGSQSVSNLASRFFPTARPEVNFLSVILNSALSGFLIAFAVMYNSWGKGGEFLWTVIVVAMFSLPLAGILMIPLYFLINSRQRKQLIKSQLQWDEAASVIRSSYFCHRDETCFNSESWSHLDSFVSNVFRNFS